VAYPKFGFASDEWTKHHQGGPTGYAPRDWPANRESAQSILINQPIAWNPTADGWKCEDTILATSTGVEIMSVDPSWPTLQIAGRARPDILLK
jgi:antitoxin VapB